MIFAGFIFPKICIIDCFWMKPESFEQLFQFFLPLYNKQGCSAKRRWKRSQKNSHFQ